MPSALLLRAAGVAGAYSSPKTIGRPAHTTAHGETRQALAGVAVADEAHEHGRELAGPEEGGSPLGDEGGGGPLGRRLREVDALEDVPVQVRVPRATVGREQPIQRLPDVGRPVEVLVDNMVLGPLPRDAFDS